MSKLPPAGTSSRLSLLSVLILRLLRLFAAKFFPCLCLSVFIRVHPWLKNGDLAVEFEFVLISEIRVRSFPPSVLICVHPWLKISVWADKPFAAGKDL